MNFRPRCRVLPDPESDRDCDPRLVHVRLRRQEILRWPHPCRARSDRSLGRLARFGRPSARAHGRRRAGSPGPRPRRVGHEVVPRRTVRPHRLRVERVERGAQSRPLPRGHGEVGRGSHRALGRDDRSPARPRHAGLAIRRRLGGRSGALEDSCSRNDHPHLGSRRRRLLCRRWKRTPEWAQRYYQNEAERFHMALTTSPSASLPVPSTATAAWATTSSRMCSAARSAGAGGGKFAEQRSSLRSGSETAPGR